MQIVTARLCLDSLLQEDAPALFAYRGDPAITRFQGWKPGALAEVVRFIEAQREVVPDQPGAWWQRAIRLRDSRALIGDLGLHFVDADTVELGVSIATAHQRRGYAREVLEIACDFVFGGLQKHRLIASVDPRNLACVTLLESLGMRREAHHREALRDGDGWADDLIYALLAREWLAPPEA